VVLELSQYISSIRRAIIFTNFRKVNMYMLHCCELPVSEALLRLIFLYFVLCFANIIVLLTEASSLVSCILQFVARFLTVMLKYSLQYGNTDNVCTG